jgi:hypothetical protein
MNKNDSENAYMQCQNCYNKKFEFFGILHCKSEGKRRIKNLISQNHCAAQNQIKTPNPKPLSDNETKTKI